MLTQKKSNQKTLVQKKVTEWCGFAAFEWYEITQKWRHWFKLKSARCHNVHFRPAHPFRVPSLLALSCSTLQDRSVMHYSIALILNRLTLMFYFGDRRTFDSAFTIACFLNGSIAHHISKISQFWHIQQTLITSERYFGCYQRLRTCTYGRMSWRVAQCFTEFYKKLILLWQIIRTFRLIGNCWVNPTVVIIRVCWMLIKLLIINLI